MMYALRPTGALVALFLLQPALLVAQGEAAAVKAFKANFKPKAKDIAMNKGVLPMRDDSPQYQEALAKQKATAAKWSAAVAGLKGYSSAKVAKLVAAAWTKVDKEVKPMWKARAKLEKRCDKEYQSLVKARGGKFWVRIQSAPAKVQAAQGKWLSTCRRSSAIRRDITILTSLHDGLRQVVSAMGQAEGLTWFLESVVGKGKHDLVLKVAAIRAAATMGSSMLPVLRSALDKATMPDELAALVLGIGGMGQAAKSAVPRFLELVNHENPGVREQAALALMHLKAPEAIEPMVALIAKESGQAKKRIVAALEVLTGQQHGMNAAAWRRWFTAEGAAYAAGKKELGKGKPSESIKRDRDNYYYGIPQDGKGIVYVIDCSGSMIVDKDQPVWGDPQRQREPEPARDKSNSRSEASKRELCRALGVLNSTQTFNIVWYNHAAELYKKAMVQATPQNVKAAQSWVRKLPADSSTNIYAAMKLAFTLVGRAGFDKSYDGFYSVAFDTIFLMTDGKPTLQALGDDDPKRIIEGVRKWNALKRVVVHTIGIGKKGIDEQFMKDLASENKGQYMDPAKMLKASQEKAKRKKAGAGAGK